MSSRLRSLLLALLCALVACSKQAPERVSATPNVVPGMFRQVDAATAAQLCSNSLIDCFPEHASYVQGIPNALRFPILQAQATSPTYGAFGSHFFNYDTVLQPPASGAYRGRWVTIPAGVTSVQLRLRDVGQNVNVGATGAVHLKLLDAEGLTTISDTTCAVGASAADCVSSAITVTPGREYQARIVVNTSGTLASFNASRFGVEPLNAGPCGLSATSFVRLDADGNMWGVNTLPGSWANPRRPDQLAFAEVRLKTNATQLCVETWENVHDYIDPNGTTNRAAFTVDVAGVGVQAIVPANNGGTSAGERAITYNLASAATSASPVLVTVRAGPQALSAYPAPANEYRGVYLAAFYAPAGAYLELVPPPKPIAAAVTDSKGDFYPSLSPRTGAAALLRVRGYDARWWGAGGDYLGNHMGSTNTTASAWPMVQALGREQPAIAFLQIQRNDWVAGTASATIYGLQIAAGDAMHSASPNTRWRVPQITKEGTENTVNGVAWDTHRSNVLSHVCASNSAIDSQPRSSWCTIPQADGLWTSGECAATGNYYSRCADTVHLTDVGYERQDRLYAGEDYPAPSILYTNAVVWTESDYGLNAGSWSSTTTGGTNPPASVPTGAGSKAVRLAWEMQSATTFRWSMDGGKSWPEQNVPCGCTASVANTVALPTASGSTAFGASIYFPAGTYNNLHTWRSDALPGGSSSHVWASIPTSAASGNDLVMRSTSDYFTWNPSNSLWNGAPTVNSNSTGGMKTPTLSIAPPYAIVVVGTLDTQGGLRALVGRNASGSTPIFYATGSTTMGLYDATSQLSATVTATNPHCYVLDYEPNGTNSTVYVDGYSSVTGNMGGGVTLTTAVLGYDSVNAVSSQSTFTMFAIIKPVASTGWTSGTFPVDFAEAICHRAAWRWGTPQ